LEITGIGERIDDDDGVVGAVLENVMDIIGADESGTSGDSKLHFAAPTDNSAVLVAFS
jgi:hypothetical protein